MDFIRLFDNYYRTVYLTNEDSTLIWRTSAYDKMISSALMQFWFSHGPDFQNSSSKAFTTKIMNGFTNNISQNRIPPATPSTAGGRVSLLEVIQMIFHRIGPLESGGGDCSPLQLCRLSRRSVDHACKPILIYIYIRVYTPSSRLIFSMGVSNWN